MSLMYMKGCEDGMCVLVGISVCSASYPPIPFRKYSSL